MKTAAAMFGVIGKSGKLSSDGMEFDIEVMDVRQVYDRVDYLVTPKNGTGSKWVAAYRVEFPNGQAL